MIEKLRAVIFDLDGTLGLFRAGWMPVMLDMMMETLGPLGPDPVLLREQAEVYVARFTGNDTLRQMEPFVEHVRALGGRPFTPPQYKAEFLRRVETRRATLREDLRNGRMERDRLLVPGSRALLEEFHSRGIPLYLASGTAHEDVCEDAEMLGIADYFQGVYGSAPESLTKRELLAHVLASGVKPDQMLTFGDGNVEIEETKAVGAMAIGVATDEKECLSIDQKKRRWLLAAGADHIIPNYFAPELPGLLSGREALRRA